MYREEFLLVLDGRLDLVVYFFVDVVVLEYERDTFLLVRDVISELLWFLDDLLLNASSTFSG